MLPSRYPRFVSIVAAAMLCAVANLASGQGNTTPAMELSNFVRAPDAVATIGPDLFGDQVNLYTGKTEFIQTDFSLRGNSVLPVAVGRRLPVGEYVLGRRAFGRWDLEIPHLHGIFSTKDGWRSISGGRCSAFSGPPSVLGSNNSGSFDASDFWHGNFLYAPGMGDQQMLVRASDNLNTPSPQGSYPAVTANEWVFSCLGALANSTGSGEGFLAISPEGTRYKFDQMASIPAGTLQKSRDALRSSGGIEQPQAPVNYLLARSEVWILPTTVTDRFGNTVTYTYDPARPMNVTRITASDGRVASFTYGDTANPNLITSVNDGTRTWSYVYHGTGNLANLDAVVLPDGSSWSFANTDALLYSVSVPTQQGCDHAVPVMSPTPRTGSMTHPSGATGTFTLSGTVHGRSNVGNTCGANGYPLSPRYLFYNSLTSKVISGAGLGSLAWSYSYGPANSSWAPCGDGCPKTKQVMVTDPGGFVTRYTFGNEYLVSDGRLVQEDIGWDGSSALRTTQNVYRAQGAGPYADKAGYSTNGEVGDGDLLARRAPLTERTFIQQGAIFRWHADAFDTHVRPTSVARYDSRNNVRSEATVYSDNTVNWVLGQIASVTESSTGAVMVANTYNATTALQETSRRFGVLQWTQSYNADGTLAARKDGNNFTTTYANYKRGVAQNIAYPNGTAESAVINNLGQADAITNGAGFATGFGFDPMGRLNAVTQPGADTVAWNATTLPFNLIYVDEYGVAGGHWRQIVATGNAVTARYYDALWRPLVTRTYDAADEGRTSKIVVRRYDFRGNVVFESYPQRFISTITDNLDGTTYTYDALGRLTDTVVDSELGDLRTTIRYQDGFTKKIIDPRGAETVFGYKTYDEPSEQWIISKDEPYGVRTAITRDQFGKALAIVQSDASYSVMRSYVYDAGARLCKIIQPESGATVLSYDGAGNVAWRAIGVALPSATSCDQASVAAAKKISYGYDQRNWLKTTTYGDASPAIGRTYYGDGVPATVSSNGTVWTYTYNKRRLLEKESLAYAGKTYGIGRTYDANGSPSTLSYPGASALSVSYAPNALGQPTQVSGYASAIDYFPNDAISSFTYASGVQHSLLQTTRGMAFRVRDAGVLHDEYRYDENGNVTGITDLEQGITTRAMTYDLLDRLQTATANGAGMWGTATYFTDGMGNLREVSVTAGANARLTHHYFDAYNRLTGIVGNTTLNIGYDSQGNVTSRGAAGYVFDQGNRLSSATGKATYVYDGWGHRVKEAKTDGSTVIQVYSRDGQLLYGSTATGVAAPVESRYLYLNGHLLAEPGVAYVHTDGLGSPVARTNAARTILSRTRYEPYGLTAAGTIPTSVGFTGHVNDADTGLVYMQQRYYDPLAGRFLSTDPVLTDVETGGSFNRYSYANNSPYVHIDPDGRDTYRVNRDLRVFGTSSRSQYNPISHTFVAVTGTDGAVAHTYSWGNDANLKGWNKDQTLDLKTARDAINNDQAAKIGGGKLDEAVGQQFDVMNKKENEHSNLIVICNCKSEADNLIQAAKNQIKTDEQKQEKILDPVERPGRE